MTPSELRSKPAKELLKMSDERRTELFTLRLKAATGQLPKHTGIRAARKEIARIATILNEPKKARGKDGTK